MSLVNQFGRPLAITDFFQGGDRFKRRENTFYFYNANRDTKDLLPVGSWEQLLSSSRFLFANVPIVRGALLEQATYSFPLQARYTGKDREWGDEAEEWLYQWKQNPTLRGAPYDNLSVSRIRLLGYKVDGDIFTVVTIDNDTGWPFIQLVRAHRIGNGKQRTGRDNVLISGPYAGKTACNGVVTDSYGRTLAYIIAGGYDTDDTYVKSDSMFQVFRPDYADEHRGIPHLCASIRSFADHKRLREYELRAMQIQSAYAIVEKNESGQADTAFEALSSETRDTTLDGTTAGLTSLSVDEGLTRYFRAGSGSGLELLRPDRPGQDWQSFEDKIVGAALYGAEWDPNFAMAIKEPGGAWARITLQKVNRCIQNNRAVEIRAQRVEDWFALNQAIKLGLMREPSDGDTYSWDYSPSQPNLTADSGNEESAKREAYKLGTMSLLSIAAEQGGWWEDLRNQKTMEARDLLTRAQQLRSEFSELSLQECISLLEQRNPNGPTASSPSDEASRGQTITNEA